ncbi:MAG TPA: DEAD/DEAH box helicase [Candidatus Polarisedimenticolaceae bacterium]
MQAVFDAVRKASTPAVWSSGIALVRADAVLGETDDGDRVVVRVALKGGMLSRTVTLWTGDGDWECSCGAKTACEHAAAAVIALKRARESGAALPSPKFEVGRVAYRLRRGPQGIELERGIENSAGFHPFEATLVALAERRVEAPAFTATQADHDVETALAGHRRGALPRPSVGKLLAALGRVESVTLDGVAVRTSGDPLLPRVAVEDNGEGFRLVLEDPPEIDERFTNGLVRSGALLRPLGEAKLTGRELHELPRGLRFAPDDVAVLVTDVLPSFEGRVPVAIRTSRLPRTVATPPRAVVQASRQGEGIVALATVVYGDPPVARVDAGRLVHLGGEVPLRDTRGEERLVRSLADSLGLAPGVAQTFAGAAAVDFKRRLDAWTGTPSRGLEAFHLHGPIVPRVRLEGDGMDLSFEVPSAGGAARRADPDAVVRAWRAGESLVPLLGGGWAPLPSDWMARFGDRIADLLAARDAQGRLARAALGDLAKLAADLDLPPPPGFRALETLAAGFDAIPSAALPPDLHGTLRHYQQRGVDWLCFLREARLGALLADDMGLGKTVQALCAIRGRTLVVAPTSVLPNWMEEIRRFRPALRACLYHGPRRAIEPDADVVVTSYALLRLDDGALAGRPWDTVVLDEAQTIKNPESQVAQAAFRLEAGFRVAMSGTPVENRLDELWSQMHFANRGLLGGRRDFQDRYARAVAEGDAGAASRLRERIRPFVLRRLKREVAPELPPRTEAVLHCELSLDERRVYDAVRAATYDDVVARLSEGGSVLAALEALLRLRQAACHPALVPGQHAETSSKVELLAETLDTVIAEGHKALVFSQWTAFLDRIEPRLREASIPFLRLDGSTVDRGEVVRRFQDEAGPPVMLVSLKAGGTGLNLTRADHVFLMDPWWNPAVEDQAADRAHRIGQDRPVLVYRIVSEETVEERILALQASKRAIADAALGEAGRAAAITRDDLLALLA